MLSVHRERLERGKENEKVQWKENSVFVSHVGGYVGFVCWLWG